MKPMVVQSVKKSPKYQFLSHFFALILGTSQVESPDASMTDPRSIHWHDRLRTENF